MTDKKQLIKKITAILISVILCLGIIKLYGIKPFSLLSEAVILSAKFYIFTDENIGREAIDTNAGYVFNEITVPTEAVVPEEVIAVTEEEEDTQATTDEPKEDNREDEKKSLTDTDEDIIAVMKAAEKKADKDKKDGDISDYKYKNDGVTDSYGKVRVKNVNKTDVDIKEKLNERLDLSIDKEKPAVLVYHTHTTETYQILDRDFYAVGALTRTNKEEPYFI